MSEKFILSELQEWIKLSEDYSMEIEKFDLVCFFCAQPFEEDLINENCELNLQGEVDESEINKGLEAFRKQINDNQTMYHSASGASMRILNINKTDKEKKLKAKKLDWGGFTVVKPPTVYFGNKR